MVIKGKLITCKREVKEFKKGKKSEEKLFITLAEAEVSESQMEELENAFVESGDKFTPEWIKNFEGYVNVSTKFDLPVKDSHGVVYDSIEDAIENGLKWMGAEAKISLNIKEGAVYPAALLLLTEGSAINAFADFEGDEDFERISKGDFMEVPEGAELPFE